MMSTLGETPNMPGEEGAPTTNNGNNNNNTSSSPSSSSPRRKKKLQAVMNDYTTKTVRVIVSNEEVVMTGRELEDEMMNMEEDVEIEEKHVMGGGDNGISGDQGMMTMGQMMSDGGGVGKCTYFFYYYGLT